MKRESNELREYHIHLSVKMYNLVGLSYLCEYGLDPQKAIQTAFEKLGYKVRTQRLHSYGPSGLLPADVMVTLDCQMETSSYKVEYFYKVTKMMQLCLEEA